MNTTRRQFLGMTGSALSLLPFSLRMVLADDGYIELEAAPTEQKLYNDDAPVSPLWTYNGNAPGPELRVKRDERLRVRLVNRLEEPTSIHWHGIRIDNSMDGVPGLTQEPVPPGGTFDYEFTPPDAGTFWYHAHNRSWNQVARGLYGPLIVVENSTVFKPENDLTLVLDDWRLDDKGVLDTESIGSLTDWSHAGRLGNWLTVNGQSLPKLTLKSGEAYRLRLINASNARILEIDPSRFDAVIYALDGQPVTGRDAAKPGPLRIAPAQRVDLLIVVEEGKSIAVEEISGPQAHPFMTLKGGPGIPPMTIKLPVERNDLPEPDLTAARKVNLTMTGGAMGGFEGITYQGKPLDRETVFETGQLWGMNGVANLTDDPLFTAERGQTIVIETVNDTEWEHAMHTHGHHFRMLDHAGRPGPWRDTFIIEPRETRNIAFVADNPGKWLLHCHMLEHAAAGMNTWFEVA